MGMLKGFSIPIGMVTHCERPQYQVCSLGSQASLCQSTIVLP